MTLQDMIDKGPEWLDTYLQKFEQGKSAPHSMIGIEAGASSRAHSENSLQWAEIAVRAAELHALENRGEHRAHALRKAMALRAWFISKLGSRPGHPVLDRDIILRWFRNENEFSLAAAKEESARWKATNLALLNRNESPGFKEELIKLRNIKSRISVLRILADAGELPNEPEWKDWLEAESQIF